MTRKSRRAEPQVDAEALTCPDPAAVDAEEEETLPLEETVDLGDETQSEIASPKTISALEAYFRSLGASRTMTRKQEAQLAAASRRGEPGAKDRMIVANLPLVVSVAKRYRNRGMDFEDLISEGNLGLIRAVEKYDPSRGFRFSTYGVWWIRNNIERAVMSNRSLVRIPIHVLKEVARYNKLVQQMERDGVRPDHAAMASDLGIGRREVERIEKLIWQFLGPPVPVDAEPDGSGHETGIALEHLAVVEPTETPEEYGWLSNVFGVKLAQSLKQLNDRERRVLTLRYGLDGAEPLTLEALGKKVGVTRERVRQIQNMALEKLRQALSGAGHKQSTI